MALISAYWGAQSADESSAIGITLPSIPHAGPWTDTTTYYQGQRYIGYPVRTNGSSFSSTAGVMPLGFPNSTTVASTPIANLVNITGATAVTSQPKYLVAQYVSDFLQPGTYTVPSTGVAVGFGVYVGLNSANSNVALLLDARIMNAAGTNLYGVQFTSAALTTTFAGMLTTGTLSGATTVTITTGCRIVFELGISITSATSAAPDVRISLGSPLPNGVITSGDTSNTKYCYLSWTQSTGNLPFLQFELFDPKVTVAGTSVVIRKIQPIIPQTVSVTGTTLFPATFRRSMSQTISVVGTATARLTHLIAAAVTCTVTAGLTGLDFIPFIYKVAVMKISRAIANAIATRISGPDDGEPE